MVPLLPEFMRALGAKSRTIVCPMVRRPHETTPEEGDARVAGAAMLVFALAFVALKYLGTVNAWKATHWLFTYDLGFVKRGLLGTMASAMTPFDVTPVAAIVAFSLGAAALFVVALGVFAWPAFAKPLRWRTRAAALAALASPGFGYLLSDLGRFDIVNYALGLGVIVATRAWGRFPDALFVVSAGVMLLIHEAALLLALPIVTLVWLDANDRLAWLLEPARWPALAARLAPVAAIAAGVTLFGGADMTLRELMPRLAARADFVPSAQSAYVLVRGLDSNVAQVLGRETAIALENGRVGPPLGPILRDSFASILPFALAQLAVALFLVRSLVGDRRRVATAAIVLGFLAPWPLLLVGVDWGRWVAIASAHCATLTLHFAPELPDERAAPFRGVGAALVAAFVILSAGTSYTMEGARWGSAETPWTGVARWMQDARGSQTWDRAFVTP